MDGSRQGGLRPPAGTGVDGRVGFVGGRRGVADGDARAFVVLAAAAAKAECDPAGDWDGFVDALWHQLDAGFGLTRESDDFGEVTRAWFEHPDDPPVVVWYSDPAGDRP